MADGLISEEKLSSCLERLLGGHHTTAQGTPFGHLGMSELYSYDSISKRSIYIYAAHEKFVFRKEGKKLKVIVQLAKVTFPKSSNSLSLP